jgi:hypothetical protein
MQRFGKLKKVFFIATSVLLEATISGVMLRELQKIILSWSPVLFLGKRTCQQCIESMCGLH